MKVAPILLLPIILGCTLPASGQDMNNNKLHKIYESLADSLSGADGVWEIFLDDRILFCITDETHNRMRIISPIISVEEMEVQDLEKCLEANFHSALDARYAITDEILWSAFIHPLKELTEKQIIDAVSQVYLAAMTFGTTYSSTDLVFPKKEEKELNKKPDPAKREKKT